MHDERLPRVTLKEQKKITHPWIFQRSLARKSENVKNGSVVDLVSSDGEWVGRGLYNGHARVAVRILTTNESDRIDREFFASRLRQALDLRTKEQFPEGNFRLAHSEGDLLSGLVIEKFGKLFVIEYFSSGMYRFHRTIMDVLTELESDAKFYWFAEEHVQKQESIDIRSPAKPEPFFISENGLNFLVAPGSQHKTGFFLDQRNNRAKFRDLAHGDALDICCNSGGFALFGKSSPRVRSMTALDIDKDVIELAKRNAAANKLAIDFIQVDLFHWLREAQAKGISFDTVLLDPAKQTRTKEELPQALRNYCDMNRIALQVVRPGGLFVTCSCSGLVSEEEFLESVRRAAFQAGKNLQIFDITGAAPDHPFQVQVQESRYLKVIWGRVL